MTMTIDHHLQVGQLPLKQVHHHHRQGGGGRPHARRRSLPFLGPFSVRHEDP